MEEKRALSKRQFAQSDFSIEPYGLMDEEGTFFATLDFKLWGKKLNLLSYFTLDNGRKIFASSWQREGYLGLSDIRLGSRVELTFKRAKKTGISYLKTAKPVV